MTKRQPSVLVHFVCFFTSASNDKRCRSQICELIDGRRGGSAADRVMGVRGGCLWEASPQDVFTDEPAVVTVGAGDEEEELPGALHAAQPGLDRVGAGLQVPARVPLHAGEVRPCIRCTHTDGKIKNEATPSFVLHLE